MMRKKRKKEVKKKRESKLMWLLSQGVKIRAWVRDGFSVDDIAKKLKISKSSLYAYKKDPGFAKFFENDKEITDYTAEESLFKMVNGYKEKVLRPIKVREIIFDEKTGRRCREIERVEYVEEEIYIKPEVNAIVYALNNRLSKKWKSKISESADGEVNLKLTIEEKKGN